MKCSLCEISCIIPDGIVMSRSSANIAVVKEDGTILCTACSEVSDWACSVTSSKKPIVQTQPNKLDQIQPNKPDQIQPNKPDQIQPNKPDQIQPNKQAQSVSSVYCLKCKDRFSTKVCKCGFKHPLYRK
jgi:hypothetical protein